MHFSTCHIQKDFRCNTVVMTCSYQLINLDSQIRAETWISKWQCFINEITSDKQWQIYSGYFCVSLTSLSSWMMFQRSLNRDKWKSTYTPTFLTSIHIIAMSRKRGKKIACPPGSRVHQSRAELESINTHCNCTLSYWWQKSNISGCWWFVFRCQRVGLTGIRKRFPCEFITTSDPFHLQVGICHPLLI